MNITDADEEDLESAMASASDQREEELQVSNFNHMKITFFIASCSSGVLVVYCWHANKLGLNAD